MVPQESLSRIRTIVERAYANHFGAHDTELTLEPFVDHYGYDMVDVVFVFDEMPPRFGGREIVDFEGQVGDDMLEEDLLIAPCQPGASPLSVLAGPYPRTARRDAPRQVDLRCVVSLVYYALFHWLANCAADALAGATKPRERSWTRAYRGLQHRRMHEQCRSGRLPGGLPSSIHRFAAAIVAMQARRHSADYDPDTRFAKGDVAAFLEMASRVIRDLQGATPAEKRALAIHVIFRERSV